MQEAAEKITAGWENGAIVIIRQGSDTMSRPAVFVFDTPTGWAWLEPSYLDPFGPASPSLHWREGELEPHGNGLAWSDGQQTISLVPFDPEDDQGGPGAALLEWRSNVRDFATERATMRARVGESLA